MSVKSAPYYWLECDHPGCGRKSTEGSDHSAWSEIDGAEESARDYDWFVEQDGVHFCEEHALARICPECGEPKPADDTTCADC